MENIMIAVDKAAFEDMNRKIDLLMKGNEVNDFERPMNVEQAAQFLSISRRTLYEYMNKRNLPFHKMGSSTRFFRSELINWLKES